jgi:hypothetical protein
MDLFSTFSGNDLHKQEHFKSTFFRTVPDKMFDGEIDFHR